MKTQRALILSLSALVAAAVLTLACAACTGPGPAYRAMIDASDTAANQTIGPKFEAYVAADAALTPGDKADWAALVNAWREAVAGAQVEMGQ